MVETKAKLFPRMTADKFIERYADFDKLTRTECREMGMEESCSFVQDVLNDGFVSEEDKKTLEKTDFPKSFISRLSGDYGNRPLERRMSYLSDVIRADSIIVSHRNGELSYNARNMADAARAFAEIGSPAIPVLEELLSQEFGPGEAVDYSFIVNALRMIGPETAPVLINAFSKGENAFDKQEAHERQIAIIDALADMGDAMIPPLMEALDSFDEGIREGAALTLGRMGNAAADAVPALTKMIENPDHYRDEMAAMTALVHIVDKPSVYVPQLVKWLDGSPVFATVAAECLAAIGPDAVDVIPRLEETMREVRKIIDDRSIDDGSFIKYLNLYQQLSDSISILEKSV